MTSNSISGIVRDEVNQEVANATVALIKQNGGSIVEYTQTDSNGFYEFFFHPEADATEENWHVAVYDQDSPIFNSFSKPYVSAALNLGIGSTNASTVFGGFKAFDATGLYEANATFAGEQPFIEATGGTTVTTFTDTSGQEYQIHAFENVGTDTFEVTLAPTNATVDVLVVGGGGGGAQRHGSNSSPGAGAGGLVFKPGVSVNQTTYTIAVGDGGSGRSGDDGGENGGDSSAFSLTAVGGGGAMTPENQSGDGGSGSGQDTEAEGSGAVGEQPSQPGDSGAFGFGNDGGSANGGRSGGSGGGGGAGAPGNDWNEQSGSGDGGAGKDMSVEFDTTFGENGLFAGGGGGSGGSGTNDLFGSGGIGGGGSGGNDNTNAENGLQNTGGGAGSAVDGTGAPADGGSGIVLIRYEI